jgi:hypothetical protein
VWCIIGRERSAHSIRTDLEQRLAATKKSREHWKGNRDYVKSLDIDVWALELALEHVVRLEHPERGDQS